MNTIKIIAFLFASIFLFACKKSESETKLKLEVICSSCSIQYPNNDSALITTDVGGYFQHDFTEAKDLSILLFTSQKATIKIHQSGKETFSKDYTSDARIEYDAGKRTAKDNF